MEHTLKKEIFWETIGPFYVYAYKNPPELVEELGPYKYIGKGQAKRGLSHIADKGYDVNDLVILQQNLNSDAEAKAVENTYIDIHDPIDNKVSGHHAEKIINTAIVELASVWESNQVSAWDIVMKIGAEFDNLRSSVMSISTDLTKAFFKSGQYKRQEIFLSVDSKYQTSIIVETRMPAGTSAQEREKFATELYNQFSADYPDFEIEMPVRKTGVKDHVVLYTNALEDGVLTYISAVQKLRS